MLTITKQSYSNLWYVDGKEVANIIIYDAHGVLLDTGRRWIDKDLGCNSLDGFPAVHEVSRRNTVKFDRLEHFFCKGTLYINAALFCGYSNVNVETETQAGGTRTCDRKWMEIFLPTTPGTWLKISEQQWGNYRNTPLGDRADAVAEVFNKAVADHPNRHLTQWGAARLIGALPAMVEAAKAN